MKAEVAVNSRQVGVRVTDLTIYSEELAAVMKGAARYSTMDIPPPLLVVEVVSPNQENRD